MGLFESIVFARGKGRFELQYLNPIIFYRAIETHLGSEDNALLGLDFKVNLLNTAQVYGHFILDEFLLSAIRARNGGWENKNGIQLGAKYFDVAGISNLDVQLEYNQIRPYTYQHETRFSNYQHYQQPLAHPMGANLREVIGIMRYQPIGPLMLTGKAIYTKQTADTDSTNWGSNVLYSYNRRPYKNDVQQDGHFIGARNPVNLMHVDLTASWQLRHNMFIDLKQIFRLRESTLDQFDNKTAYTSITFRWNLQQRIHEF